MTPSPPSRSSVYFFAIFGGSMWVSNGLLVWSIFGLGGGGGMQYNRLVFQARRCLRALSLGGYCRL